MRGSDRVDQRGEHLAIGAGTSYHSEALDATIELAELALEIVELAAGVDLAAERVADVMDATGRAMVELERAPGLAAKCAARMIGARCGEVAGPRASVGERGELVVVEQIRRVAGAARTAGKVTDRERLARRARPARRDARQQRRDRTLLIANRAGEPRLFGVRARTELCSESCMKLDQLAGARSRLTQLDQQPLDRDQHAATVAPISGPLYDRAMTTRWLILLAITACGAPTPPSAPAPAPAPAPDPAPNPSAGSDTTSPSMGGAVCGTRGAAPCPADEFCSYAIGADCGATDKPGHCMAKPQLCPHLVKPVCGCDGTTYHNDCEASRAGTGLKSAGACP